MPRKDEFIVKPDKELVEELSKVHTRADRKVILDSRKLSILTEDCKNTMTCVLPLDVYERLEKMKRSYRTIAYWKWRKAYGSNKCAD